MERKPKNKAKAHPQAQSWTIDSEEWRRRYPGGFPQNKCALEDIDSEDESRSTAAENEKTVDSDGDASNE